MAGTAIRRRLNWSLAEVVDVVTETPRARTIVMIVPGWPGHLAGQHIDIRLTAEDGYQAQRSYSMATPTDGDRVAITVEVLADGEVSPYLFGELRTGDRLEIRGPIGGYFVWDPAADHPVQLIGGGSGVVPLMAMVRARLASGSDVAMRYLSSARAVEDVLYRDQLSAIDEREIGIEVVHTLTRSWPQGWTGPTRRVDREMLEEHALPVAEHPLCFVCGPTGFVEAVATLLVDLGHDPVQIKTERFGPTGG